MVYLALHLNTHIQVFSISGIIFNIIQKSYLIIMGYGLIVIAGILKKGAALREENELTI